MDYAIFPPEQLIEEAVIEMPPSKSVANRALMLASLTPGQPLPDDSSLQYCDDIRLMHKALKQWADKPDTPHTFDLDLAGTAMRFLTARFAAQPGADVTLTGNARMLRRPIGPLVEALRACGADIAYTGEEGFPPLHIRGRKLAGGSVEVDPGVSSQFVSALLMVGPLMEHGLDLKMTAEPVSLPYILMTLAMMERRGIEAEREPLRIVVPKGSYAAVEPESEGDWSAASYWYELTGILSCWLTLKGLKEKSLQGDARARELFGELGVVTEPSEETPDALDLQPSPEVFGRLTLNLADNPDLAPALAVAACMMGVPFHFTGLGNLAVKECDRLAALQTEIARIGMRLDRPSASELEWDGNRRPITELPVFDTYGDHRMAMALAPVSCFVPGIVVRGAECVAKSYPAYWEHLQSLGFILKEVSEKSEVSENSEFSEKSESSEFSEPNPPADSWSPF